MKEVVFLNTNARRWQEFEAILRNPRVHNPDKIADLFVQLTDDLAFSRTYYPKSKTTAYLNHLTLMAHQIIYRNKREKTNRIVSFWRYEYPLLIRENRKYILYSFCIFFIAICIGAISAANDDSFVRLILGNDYVDRTLLNIENNDPMAIYKSANEIDMFVGITVNNIWVSFLAFILGSMFSIGTGYILFSNGVMLGSFQYFFFQHGLLYDSILSIWIHGTIEIWSIIVAGAAGLIIGNSLLFPKTYSRKISFRHGARTGLKMAFGLVPFFIIAGFLEGFITRYTNWPDIIRIAIIVASLMLIIWYFFIYPEKIYKEVH